MGREWCDCRSQEARRRKVRAAQAHARRRPARHRQRRHLRSHLQGRARGAEDSTSPDTLIDRSGAQRGARTLGLSTVVALVYMRAVPRTGADEASAAMSMADLAAAVSALQVELVGVKSRMHERDTENESLRE